ncbi:peptide MFS transporter [Chryseolinea lacunae]|uniref:Peptide MFS transporter n=1 Tax=Chryseolinea lacunae TaxID=2801331 RepID=A0ABS1KKF9_9BACT|nr:peptide MFS transporter [Chryseolinea lacunae]MBL0739835.1 peptide MFS transporter [Chryseolinea lacunae]
MQPTFFGHPRGLATLFFTEMWERFSYYGMRALLMLFMITSAEKGGLGLNEDTGGAIYGIYTMMVYMLALPGGWIADNVCGLRKSVFYGACTICLGHLLMAFSNTETFFVGLLLIAVGTGLLKPNISSLVGELYAREENARRDSGFSIFFMGINIGAFVAPFITGYFGEKVNWHYGFALAGAGMLAGLVQYKITEKYLPEERMTRTPEERKKNARTLGIVSALVGLLVLALVFKIVVVDPVWIAKAFVYIIVGSAVLYFGYLLFVAGLDAAERRGVLAILSFFVMSVIFYMGYEQQGSSLNLFALRYTDLALGGFVMPASWLQAVPAVGVLIFAPFFAWLWLWLSKRNIDPAIPVKLSFGLLFISASFFVMTGAAYVVMQGQKALPLWLIFTYMLHTFGEICLYPVGLSAVKKLAPQKFAAQLMGVWFLSLSLGNLLAGLLTSNMSNERILRNPGAMVELFLGIAIGVGLAGIVMLVLSKRLRFTNSVIAAKA